VGVFHKYNLPDNKQILAELIQAGGETLLFMFDKLINSISNKKELILFGIRKNYLIRGRRIYEFTKKGDKTDCHNC
jgi:hypothetical protein